MLEGRREESEKKIRSRLGGFEINIIDCEKLNSISATGYPIQRIKALARPGQGYSRVKSECDVVIRLSAALTCSRVYENCLWKSSNGS